MHHFLLQAGPDRKHHTIIIIITITMSIIVVIIIISIIIIEPLCKYLAPGQKEGPEARTRQRRRLAQLPMSSPSK